jgi:predicted RNA binding protein YcfA (HicA-like mRNA interferase family)
VERLQKAGCYFVREGKGSHEIWYSPLTNRTFTVPANIVSRHLANTILKQAGLPKAF